MVEIKNRSLLKPEVPLLQTGEVKYYHANKSVWKIARYNDGLWRDEYGCIYALAEDENSVDQINRCGIGWFSLPKNHPANPSCAVHDYKYSCLAYQLFHDRAEADYDLKEDLKRQGYTVLGILFWQISKVFGRKYWEVRKTR